MKIKMYGFVKIGKVLFYFYNLLSRDVFLYITNKLKHSFQCTIFLSLYRYNTKSRSFKKIKIFWNEPEHIKLTYRETTLEPTRVMSVFKVRTL